MWPTVLWTALACPYLAPAECTVWQQLYDSTRGSNWTYCSGNRNNPCDCSKPGEPTYGVSCSGGANGTQSITQLVLFENNMAGPLPDGLGTLHSLNEITLNDNKLTGTLPPSLTNLSAINWLWLHNNQLQGRVPAMNFDQCAGYCDLGNYSDASGGKNNMYCTPLPHDAQDCGSLALNGTCWNGGGGGGVGNGDVGSDGGASGGGGDDCGSGTGSGTGSGASPAKRYAAARKKRAPSKLTTHKLTGGGQMKPEIRV